MWHRMGDRKWGPYKDLDLFLVSSTHCGYFRAYFNFFGVPLMWDILGKDEYEKMTMSEMTMMSMRVIYMENGIVYLFLIKSYKLREVL